MVVAPKINFASLGVTDSKRASFVNLVIRWRFDY